jgi:trimeric autotransporter adhesin
MQANTTASNNTAVGYFSLAANTTGAANAAFGYQALDANTTANGNTAIGYTSTSANTTGADNTALGAASLLSNTTGDYNVAIGTAALDANTTADANTAVGHHALGANTTAIENTAVGSGALANCTTGTRNTAMGKNSATALTTATDVSAIGRNALLACTTGSNNIAMGTNCLDSVTTGANNTAVGSLTGDDLTTGSQNVAVGGSLAFSAVGATNQTVMGYAVTCVGNGNFTFGDGTTDSNIANGATSITAPSDVRLKEDIQDEKVGLDFINDLRPVTFQWKKEKDVPSEMKAHVVDSEKRVMNGKYNHGFIAQEVKEVIDNYDLKDGFDMWTEDETDGRQRIGEASLMPLMVKAVQELSAKVEELEDKLNNKE